jgi:hypothetical protein
VHRHCRHCALQSDDANAASPRCTTLYERCSPRLACAATKWVRAGTSCHCVCIRSPRMISVGCGAEARTKYKGLPTNTHYPRRLCASLSVLYVTIRLSSKQPLLLAVGASSRASSGAALWFRHFIRWHCSRSSSSGPAGMASGSCALCLPRAPALQLPCTTPVRPPPASQRRGLLGYAISVSTFRRSDSDRSREPGGTARSKTPKTHTAHLLPPPLALLPPPHGVQREQMSARGR